MLQMGRPRDVLSSANVCNVEPLRRQRSRDGEIIRGLRGLKDSARNVRRRGVAARREKANGLNTSPMCRVARIHAVRFLSRAGRFAADAGRRYPQIPLFGACLLS